MKTITEVALATLKEKFSGFIVKFDQNDFPLLKDFVLKETKTLNREYFITDDIDTALYEILEDEAGIVYGITYNSKIIVLLAVDIRKEISDFFSGMLGIKKRIAEVGWALVKEEYRGHKFIYKPNSYLENIVRDLNQIECLTTTVHPENISGLAMFFNEGYFGVKIFSHYGSIRMLLVKYLQVTNTLSNEGYPQSLIGEFEEQKRLFDSGYICQGFSSNSQNCLLFKKNQIV